MKVRVKTCERGGLQESTSQRFCPSTRQQTGWQIISAPFRRERHPVKNVMLIKFSNIRPHSFRWLQAKNSKSLQRLSADLNIFFFFIPCRRNHSKTARRFRGLAVVRQHAAISQPCDLLVKMLFLGSNVLEASGAAG